MQSNISIPALPLKCLTPPPWNNPTLTHGSNYKRLAPSCSIQSLGKTHKPHETEHHAATFQAHLWIGKYCASTVNFSYDVTQLLMNVPLTGIILNSYPVEPIAKLESGNRRPHFGPFPSCNLIRGILAPHPPGVPYTSKRLSCLFVAPWNHHAPHSILKMTSKRDCRSSTQSFAIDSVDMDGIAFEVVGKFTPNKVELTLFFEYCYRRILMYSRKGELCRGIHASHCYCK